MPETEITIREFAPGDEQDFRKLNEVDHSLLFT